MNRKSCTFCCVVERVAKIEVLSGAPLLLDCPLPPGRIGGSCSSSNSRLGPDQVRWQFAAFRSTQPSTNYQQPEESGSTDNRTVDTEGPMSEFILTREGGLITLGARVEHSGSYSCSIGGAAVVRHDVIVLRKRSRYRVKIFA
jgi:hypothetical protein